MKRVLSIFIVLIVIILTFIGCSNTESKTEEDKILFTDSCGRTVKIPKKIEKIIPCGNVAQTFIYPLAYDLFSALSVSFEENQTKYIDNSLLSLPVIGKIFGSKGDFNLEEVVNINPDLLIDIGEKKDGIKENIDNIQTRTGIPTIFIEADIESFGKAYENLGKILSREKRASELSEYIESVLDYINNSKMKLDGNSKKIAYLCGNKADHVNPKGSLHADLIEYIGGENSIVSNQVNSTNGSNVLNFEELLKSDTDIILIDNINGYNYINTEEKYKELDAVKNNSFYFIPNEPYNYLSTPPSVNKIEGLLWLSNLIYPDVYTENIYNSTKEFYDLFYNYKITDDEVKDLFKLSIIKRDKNYG